MTGRNLDTVSFANFTTSSTAEEAVKHGEVFWRTLRVHVLVGGVDSRETVNYPTVIIFVRGSLTILVHSSGVERIRVGSRTEKAIGKAAEPIPQHHQVVFISVVEEGFATQRRATEGAPQVVTRLASSS